MNRAVSLLLFVTCSLLAGGSVPAAEETSCTVCHGNEDYFGEEGLSIIREWQDGVHAEVGISCHDCHGGNPAARLADDLEAAMDPGYDPNPFLGTPEVRDIPEFCGRCHADASFMKRFKPDARVDQLEEYRTSGHGKALREGNTRVAQCTSCHGAHGVLRAGNPRSPVYPTHVAETCGSCHSDPDYMSGSREGNGRLPVDQVPHWRESVHARALLEKGDLSAPTCNDCHGNHGAAPPGLESVTYVCGMCHGREAGLFRDSPKHEGFVRHNEYLEEAGEESCRTCHDSGMQFAATGVQSLGECTACHENHFITRPTITMFLVLPPTPCAICHGTEVTTPPPEDSEPERVRLHFREVRDSLLTEGRESGLEDEKLFDWLVDRARKLPFHTLRVQEGEETGKEKSVLRPSYARLFEKFRIGPYYNTYTDPRTGRKVERRVRLCSDCHIPSDGKPEPGSGRAVAGDFVDMILEQTTVTAMAERTLLAAQRGGVEVTDARDNLDRAIDAQIDMQVLVHTFQSGDGSQFVEAYETGMKHAGEALEESRRAYEELGVRRRGLAVSLVFIVLVLIALWLTIRRLDARRR